MNARAIIVALWFGLASSAAAQSGPTGKASHPIAAKEKLSEIRALIHELEGRADKLRELNTLFRSQLEERPQAGEQLDKWNAALERLLRRIDAAREAVADNTRRLDQAAAGQTLPTALGKELANTRNEAEAQRTAAEQALAKNKSKAAANKTKQAKQAPPKQATERSPAHSLDDDL